MVCHTILRMRIDLIFVFKVGIGEKNLLFLFCYDCESYDNGTQEIICHLWRVFTAYFVLLLPNVADENELDWENSTSS